MANKNTIKQTELDMGEEITEDYIRFVIEKMDKNRIDTIHVYLTEPEQNMKPEHK